MSTVHGGQGNIVTSGLVLNLDAANPRSYPPPYNGTTWTDLSGNSNNGTLTNGPTFNSGNVGSIVFDGSNDFVNFGNIFNFSLSNSFTISVWFKTTISVAGVLISKQQSGPPYAGYHFGIGTDGSGQARIGVEIVNTSTATMRRFTSSVYNDNKWYNAVFTYNGSSLRSGIGIYINGTIPTLIDSLDPSLSGTITTSSPFQIGSRNSAIQFFKDNIAQTLIYNRALSASEILQNYNATRARFGV